jgi:hypothetical protein
MFQRIKNVTHSWICDLQMPKRETFETISEIGDSLTFYIRGCIYIFVLKCICAPLVNYIYLSSNTKTF